MSFKLLIAPVFLVLSYVTYAIPSPICIVPGPYGFLSSMWFMYLVMAAAHSGPWGMLLFTSKRAVPGQEDL